jgi:hypothetical protein
MGRDRTNPERNQFLADIGRDGLRNTIGNSTAFDRLLESKAWEQHAPYGPSRRVAQDMFNQVRFGLRALYVRLVLNPIVVFCLQQIHTNNGKALPHIGPASSMQKVEDWNDLYKANLTR